MNKTDNGRLEWLHYLLVIFMFLAVFASFRVFMQENQERILAQNQEYAEDISKQTARMIEDRLEARRRAMNVLSYTVSGMISEPTVTSDYLKFLQDTSVFDYVEFIDTKGTNHNADGKTSDSTDRENYIEGMKGKTGCHVIFNSRITNETLVNFYAPVKLDGEIIGVLNGMLREETLREVLALDFFGLEAKSFICMSDGTVISFYGYDEKPMDNFIDGLKRDKVVTEEILADIEEAFRERKPYRYSAKATYGRGGVSVIPVADDWMLVQTFPSAVTGQMESKANKAGMKLELRLLILFLVYVAYLILKGMKKHGELLSEKVRLGNIVQSLTPLFARLTILDYERQSYEYIQGSPPNLPPRGSLSDLKQYMDAHYIHENDVSPANHVFDEEKIKNSLAQGKPYLQYEYRIMWDDIEYWEDVSVLALEQKDGMPSSVIFAIQDVTSLKKQEAAIQQALRDAFHAAEDLSQAKSDFLARMSHDMRTPMNAVLGMAQIAITHLDDSCRVNDCLKKIDESGRCLLSLINEALDMSKIESGGIVLDEAPFVLTEALDEVYREALSQASKKGLHLHLGIGNLENDHVIGDVGRLKQVLSNILDNAVKYTPCGGKVEFRANELPSRTKKSGYYEFSVEDTGIGIDRELQSKIFEPFVRGDAESSQGYLGTGLGLPITQVIVKLMDGDIHLESKIGQGTKFTVHLFLKLPDAASQPFTDTEEAAVGKEDDGSDLISRHAGKRALLVEDNELNMEIAAEILEMAQIEVETAENGEVAVSMVQSHPENYYDVILMDLQMPVMDGYEAARAIRNLGKEREDLLHIPIIAVSANAFQEDVSRAEDMGMNGHVMKPIDLEKVLAALDKWLPRG